MKCFNCKENAFDEDVVLCSSCSQVYHFFCVDLTEKNFRKLNKQNKTNFRCKSCKQLTDNLTPHSAGTVTRSELSTKTVAPSVISMNYETRAMSNSKQAAPSISPNSSDTYSVEENHKLLLETIQRKNDDMKQDIINFITQKFIDVENKIKNIQVVHDEILNSIKFMSDKYDDLNNKLIDMDTKTKKIIEVGNKISQQEKKIEKLEDALEDILRDKIKNNIEIRGLHESTNEKCTTLLKDIAEKVQCPIPEGEVITASRTQSKPGSIRPIIVELKTQEFKNRLIKALKTYNICKDRDNRLSTRDMALSGDKSFIFISEQLTKNGKFLIGITRKKAKELSYKFVWTRDGKIYVRKEEGASYKTIAREQDLSQL